MIIVHFSRLRDWIICYKKVVSVAPRVLLKEINLITVIDLSEQVHMWGLVLLNINMLCAFVQLIDIFPILVSITSFLKSFLWVFLTFLFIPPCYNLSVLYAWIFDLVLLFLTVWIHVMISLSEISFVLTIFMPITGFLKWA